jgi:4-hydroxy-tetrahydrodipicolinate reductase
MTVRIGITGAAGRMGRMLAEAIAGSDAPAKLTAAIERPESTLLGADMGELLGGDASGVVISSDLAAVADQIDVLIDFTVPESTLAQAAICAAHGLPMVVGTTGFSDEQGTGTRHCDCW